ncbi:hypothetical protein SAMN04488511_11434 [Pedobacter suwonensis]|uniref:Uncharacterized protein n=1 Tax=Pedobacter suwonensis TaxID=332999 RepID=A0A1I0TT50_9SPHI|nr:hypothetical protein [Pedobacter suwonensis]SFA54880.1 hypothetical protein SAMN04488511_11434 [Pedobacter suwonensis]
MRYLWFPLAMLLCIGMMPFQQLLKVQEANYIVIAIIHYSIFLIFFNAAKSLTELYSSSKKELKGIHINFKTSVVKLYYPFVAMALIGIGLSWMSLRRLYNLNDNAFASMLVIIPIILGVKSEIKRHNETLKSDPI